MVDYNTLQKKRNMLVGGFVVIAFCALLWMVFIFGELPVIVSSLRSFNVLVKFPDALGVQTGTPIYYCGYQVGKVINVMSPDVYQRLAEVPIFVAGLGGVISALFAFGSAYMRRDRV